MLSDYDIFYLLSERLNIAQLLVSTYKNKCGFCNTVCDKDNSVEFQCGCKICNKCNMTKINRATNGLIVLNRYEESIIILLIK